MIDENILSRAALERLERLGGNDFLRQMIGLFLQHGPERIRELDEGLHINDAAQVERAAHSLKSSAGNLGVTRLQEAAQSLELLGAAGTIDVAAAELVRNEYTAGEAALRVLLQRMEP
jgi:HPt (histidine-containing phosphotransfer) domain-containing protein